jgi:hypothetical protein
MIVIASALLVVSCSVTISVAEQQAADHMLPPWSDSYLKAGAEKLDASTRDRRKTAESLIQQLDETIAGRQRSGSDIAIRGLLSRLEYERVRVQGLQQDAAGLIRRLDGKSTWRDRAGITVVTKRLDELERELLMNRIFFERAFAQKRLKESR